MCSTAEAARDPILITYVTGGGALLLATFREAFLV